MEHSFGDDEPISDDDIAGGPAAANAEGLRQRIIEKLEELEAAWLCSSQHGPLAILSEQYRWGESSYCPEHALSAFESGLQDISILSGGVERIRGPDGGEEGQDVELKPRVAQVMRAIQESYHTLVALSGWSGHVTSPVMTTDDMIVRFSTTAVDKDSDIQLVYKFILEWCMRMQLRHRGDVVYHEIMVNGRKTRAWVPATTVLNVKVAPTMKDLISFICTRKRNEAIYNKQLNVSSSKLIEKLEMCREMEFPVLKTTRSWISWKDGIYNVYNDIFLYYTDERIAFPEDMAVCAYHPINFGPAWLGADKHSEYMTQYDEWKASGGEQPVPRGIPLHPFELPTPFFDSIMEVQKLCGKTKFWLMAMMGRCLFWSNMLDAWQVVLYVKGIAGTGKSTLVQLIAGLYDQTDVFVIPNCTEGTFGLQGLTPDKLLWIAPEVKEDFNMDQAQFQSLVSNERVAFPRKHMNQFEGKIASHGIMAGNLTPAKWNDNASSIQRRVFMINFAHQVPSDKKNADLMAILKTVELAKILRKIVFCYHRAVLLVGSGDVWNEDLLSSHIMQQHKSLGESSNPLRRFLSQGECVSGVKRKVRTADPADEFFWCPKSVFDTHYNEWRKECDGDKRGAGSLTEDVYGAIFADYGLTVERAEYVWEDAASNAQTGDIVVGCVPFEQTDKMITIEGQDNPRIQERLDTCDPLLLTQAMYEAMP
ncbi:hypothetical protein JKP88DRAFT_276190 [Tribonema minus]|uniref:SF3 helicase domain-containing protein n=1 Tax=Tribonema minus TaxID=303371 RepID=A0A836CJ87_9STRA|nr:hypothetical protein JKP88DRAFT_276190 [Tribonema minus]